MRETGTPCQNYLRLYETSWSELQADIPRLRDYPNGSIQTTWSISYECIKKSDHKAAKLLQLWAYINHQDLWFELLKRGSRASKGPDWFQDVIQSEITFSTIVRKLLGYSLIEPRQDTQSYSIHTVVHDWCGEAISRGNVDLTVLALTVVGSAVPSQLEPKYWLLQQRLLPHANRCLQQLSMINVLKVITDESYTNALHNLGTLYKNQGKMAEAKKMYQRALNGYEKAWGAEHTSTLDIVNNLGVLYKDQGKMAGAEKMYQRALNGYQKLRSVDHPSTTLIRRDLDSLKE
ncbi:hypothetical protein MMC21_004784 [Puttea exsequens]|nr:hypothetical protein [Puttea exsequens]